MTKKYKFEQFNFEIENPEIEISKDITISVQNKTFSVKVILMTQSTKVAVFLENISYSGKFDEEKISELVILKLEEFAV